MWKKLKETDWDKVMLIAITFFLVSVFCYKIYQSATMPNEPLKEFKDGVQNHLVWSIKGECFFVRPNDNVTVYLVKVPDCDRK